MSSPIRSVFWLAVLAYLLVGCARMRQDVPPGRGGPVIVQVENRDQQDVTVYLVRSGQQMRLGTVTAASASVFEVSPSVVESAGELRLMADPIGARGRLISEAVVVRPGQRLEWTIDIGLRRGSLSVY